jgi:hypothetical protein
VQPTMLTPLRWVAPNANDEFGWYVLGVVF